MLHRILKVDGSSTLLCLFLLVAWAASETRTKYACRQHACSESSSGLIYTPKLWYVEASSEDMQPLFTDRASLFQLFVPSVSPVGSAEYTLGVVALLCAFCLATMAISFPCFVGGMGMASGSHMLVLRWSVFLPGRRNIFFAGRFAFALGAVTCSVLHEFLLFTLIFAT